MGTVPGKTQLSSLSCLPAALPWWLTQQQRQIRGSGELRAEPAPSRQLKSTKAWHGDPASSRTWCKLMWEEEELLPLSTLNSCLSAPQIPVTQHPKFLSLSVPNSYLSASQIPALQHPKHPEHPQLRRGRGWASSAPSTLPHMRLGEMP